MGALLPECQKANAPVDLPPVSWSMQSGKVSPVGDQFYLPRQSRPGRQDVRVAQDIEKTKEPPTEFQRLAASSVGQLLPLFGASLFEKVPTTFAPVDRVPVGSDYVIGPGDELVLRLWGQVNLSLELTVDRAGAIYVPQAGSIKVAGLQFQQLSGFLHSQLERVFRNFDLSVNMGELRSIQVFVVGQARRPGSYTVSSLSTLVNAVFASGGPSGQGSMRRIQLKRGAQVVAEFDLYDLLLEGDKSKDARLLSGDVVYIPPVGPQVAAAGSVKNAAIYELRDEKTVGQLLRLAGGLSPVADSRRATVERIKQRSFREAVEFSLEGRGLDTAIEDGDVFQVRSIVPRFENTVTLRGNVANPGRFAWRPGMHLRDIIPDKESLVTRQYWKKRNRLGLEAPEEKLQLEDGKDAERDKETEKPKVKEKDQSLESAPVKLDLAAAEINWSYAVIERRDPADLSARLIHFHLGKLILEKDDSQNLELQSGDVVTVFSQKDFRVPVAQQNRVVWLEGEFNAAGMYVARPGETLGSLIQRAGGLTPQAYLFAAQFLRDSTRREQQRGLEQFASQMEQQFERAASTKLGNVTSPEESNALLAKMDSERRYVQKLRTVQATGRIILNLDPSESGVSKLMEIPLEDGDRLIVPSRPSTISVLGAVYNQNSFVYEPGLRVADYLSKAGGFTRTADKRHLFILRADGSVIPKQGQAHGIFKTAFEASHLNPGDSIVAPEGLFRTTFLRGLKDWSQVISQFALGAAAVNVLK